MKFKLFLFIIFSILIEATILPYPLVLTVIFIANNNFTETMPEMLFFYGLLLDLFSLRLLGSGSLIFLSLFIVNHLYAKKLQNKSLPFQIFLYILLIFIYNLLYYSLSNLMLIFWEIAVGSAVLILFERIFPHKKETGKKLSV